MKSDTLITTPDKNNYLYHRETTQVWASLFRPILLFILLLPAINLFTATSLIEVYKKGTIKLIPALDFGKETDWESLFYDTNKDLAVTKDGTIFVSNNSKHNIFKFNASGEFSGKFGQKGSGPADLYYPHWLSILDDTFLVVGEYSLRRRISLFDFSGNCKKVIRCKHPVYHPTALKNGKIAYMTYQEIQGQKKQKNLIIIKDIHSGVEQEIDAIVTPVTNRIQLKKGSMSIENQRGDVMIGATEKGNLLVGVSNSPHIKIYSLDGRMLKSFRLNIKPIPVTDTYIQTFKRLLIQQTNSNRRTKWMAKVLQKASFTDLFGKHLPLYRDIIVDSEGNVLVFKWNKCRENCVKVFQVYSPDGTFICETKIDEGDFDFNIQYNGRDILFVNGFIYGLFQIKDSDEVSLRIVKVGLRQ